LLPLLAGSVLWLASWRTRFAAARLWYRSGPSATVRSHEPRCRGPRGRSPACPPAGSGRAGSRPSRERGVPFALFVMSAHARCRR